MRYHFQQAYLSVQLWLCSGPLQSVLLTGSLVLEGGRMEAEGTVTIALAANHITKLKCCLLHISEIENLHIVRSCDNKASGCQDLGYITGQEPRLNRKE